MPRYVYRDVSPETGGFLHGIREIARWMRVATKTVQKWHKDYGLPLVKSPDGNHFITSRGALDQWIISTSVFQREVEDQRVKKKHTSTDAK